MPPTECGCSSRRTVYEEDRCGRLTIQEQRAAEARWIWHIEHTEKRIGELERDRDRARSLDEKIEVVELLDEQRVILRRHKWRQQTDIELAWRNYNVHYPEEN